METGNLNIFRNEEEASESGGEISLTIDSPQRASLYEIMALAMRQGHSFLAALEVLEASFSGQRAVDANLKNVIESLKDDVVKDQEETVGHLLGSHLSPLTAFEKTMLLLIKTKVSALKDVDTEALSSVHTRVADTLESISKQVMREHQEEIDKRTVVNPGRR
jgi:hypothetical protein